MALALPYDVSAGTRAGDLMFNSNQAFALGSAADYDVYSVPPHEAGHVFGLPGSDDPASAMYQVADRVRTGLSAADLQAVQLLYGPRKADAFEGTTGNDTQAKAAKLQRNSGGVFVAAGDVTGDGVPEVVVTPDEGGGPRVRVFGGTNFAPAADFFGIDDPNFRGGTRAAVSDLNADSTGDVIVAAGFQGGPRVAAFDGAALTAGNYVKVFGDFFTFEQTLRDGTYVAAGDIDGDGYADLIGGGPGGGPRVVAYSGKDLLANQYALKANFFAGDPADRSGVRVAIKTLDADGLADVVVGVGRRIVGYSGINITPDATPPTLFNDEVTLDLVEGVYVG